MPRRLIKKKIVAWLIYGKLGKIRRRYYLLSCSGVTDGEEWETSLVRVRGSKAAVPPMGDRSKNRG